MACWSSARDTRRCAVTNRSSCPAVIGPASPARSASVGGVAIRVSARTLAYDIRPAANSAVMTGRQRSARATRTCSRAVPGATWHFHASQAAQEASSQLAHPRRASKSPTSTRNRHVAAARCPASSQISASSRSSGRPCSPGPAALAAPHASSLSLARTVDSIMCLSVDPSTDNLAGQHAGVPAGTPGPCPVATVTAPGRLQGASPLPRPPRREI